MTAAQNPSVRRSSPAYRLARGDVVRGHGMVETVVVRRNTARVHVTFESGEVVRFHHYAKVETITEKRAS